MKGGWLLALVAVAAAVALALVLHGAEPWRAELLLDRRDALREAAAAAPVLALAVFVVVYFTIISAALPVGPPMSLIAGFLFGRWLGTGAILLAATAGAFVVYSLARVSARTPLGRRLQARAGPLYERIATDLRADAFGYLLVMRLLPIFPFSLVNVVAGVVGLPARAFLLATLFGRMPAAFLYVSLGEEVGRVSSLDELASPRIALLLAALGLLASASLFVRSWLERRRPARRS